MPEENRFVPVSEELINEVQKVLGRGLAFTEGVSDDQKERITRDRERMASLAPNFRSYGRIAGDEVEEFVRHRLCDSGVNIRTGGLDTDIQSLLIKVVGIAESRAVRALLPLIPEVDRGAAILPHSHFIVEVEGSIKDRCRMRRIPTTAAFHTLEEALDYIDSDNAEIVWPECFAGPSPNFVYDRIIVWECFTNGQRRVVWHFSGVCFDETCRDLPPHEILPQGKLSGHEKSLYAEMQRMGASKTPEDYSNAM